MIWKQRTGQDHVDIITFYNEIFIPAVKPLLVELGPAGTTALPSRIPEANNNNDGKPFTFSIIIQGILMLYSVIAASASHSNLLLLSSLTN